MSAIKHARPKCGWAAVLVLALGLAMTAFGFFRERELVRRGQVITWDEAVDGIQPLITDLLGRRFDKLPDGAEASFKKAGATPEGWADFLQQVNWQPSFPGMEEVGYAEPDLKSYRVPVKYISSRAPVSAHPPGFDLYRDPSIRLALQNVVRRGYGVCSPELLLGTETNAERVIIGVFLTGPLDRVPGGGVKFREKGRGFLFFALNQAKYIESCRPSFDKLAQASMPVVLKWLPNDIDMPGRSATQRPLVINSVTGQWHFVATMGAPKMLASPPQWIVLCGGTAVSFLLFSLFSTQTRLRLTAETAHQEVMARDGEITALNRDLEQRIAARTTELSQANEYLARFEAVIGATTDLVAMTDLQGRVLFINRAGRELMEFEDNVDISALHMAQFYPDDVNRLFNETAIPQAMRDGFWAGETRLLTATGREVPVSFVGLVIKSPSGEPLHLACVARDISERKEAERELQVALLEEQELNRLKSNFISMVTHEIRTPLALILGSSEILSRYLERLAPEKRRQHLDTINSAVERMRALMEDVLLFSRAEAGRMEFKPVRVDLPAFCAKLADELASATSRRCPIALSVRDVAEPARADESLLRHIFANLLTNAIKYSTKNSPVIFSVSRDGGDALFKVSDTGVGIPRNEAKRLFTPFFRGANVAALQGTGLGLMIVKHCVERHGGSVEIESAENSGTVVTVRLPLFSPAHTEFIARIHTTDT